MTGPLVSIVLPTHNGQRYLDQAIGSCRAQTHNAWELIVVDDASTDRTPEILARHAAAEPRIRCIRLAGNRGPAGALNVGFAAARGDYLTWTSDDNLYEPTALSEMAAFLGRHGDSDLIYCDYTRIDGAGRVLGVTAAAPASDIAFANVVGACFMYRRRVYERLGGYAEDSFCAEDYEYWLRAARHFRLVPLQRNLYRYRLHAGALTATRARQARRATERVLATHLPKLRRLGRQARAKGYLLTLGRLAEGRHDRRQSFLYALRALCLAPRYVLGSHADLLARLLGGPLAARVMRGPYRQLKRALRAAV